MRSSSANADPLHQPITRRVVRQNEVVFPGTQLEAAGEGGAKQRPVDVHVHRNVRAHRQPACRSWQWISARAADRLSDGSLTGRIRERFCRRRRHRSGRRARRGPRGPARDGEHRHQRRGLDARQQSDRGQAAAKAHDHHGIGRARLGSFGRWRLHLRNSAAWSGGSGWRDTRVRRGPGGEGGRRRRHTWSRRPASVPIRARHGWGGVGTGAHAWRRE